MSNLLQDARYGFRMLAKNPGFTAVAVLTLALGIGANTAEFSVVYTTLLRPLPYRQPDRLVTLGESRAQAHFSYPDTSYPDYLDWTAHVRSFESLAGYSFNAFTYSSAGAPETLFAASVTSNFFSTLGVKVELGRDFVSGEDRTGGPKLVLLSHKFWKERMGANPKVVGQTMRLDRESFTVIGVLPEDFEFAQTNSPPLWVPLNPNPDMAKRRNLRWLNVIGRLRQGTLFSQAFAEMQAINAQLAAAYPQQNKSIHIEMSPLREQIVGQVRPLLPTLFAAVSFVLLIACANVAHLLLARGAARQREIAIRMALGAGRGAVLRQFLIESLMLASVGGALGILLSVWGVSLMLLAIPQSQLAAMPYLSSVKVDPAVLAFTFVVAVVTGVLFGLAPGLQLTRADVNHSLKEQSRGSAGMATSRLRDLLVVGEIALALVLLVGAGLMVKSVRALLKADPGFETKDLLTFSVNLPSTSYPDPPNAVQFEHRFGELVRNLPGVQGVSTVSVLPLTGGGNTIRFIEEGRPVRPGEEDEANIRTIGTSYFEVMKIPLLEGRSFAANDDDGAPRRVMINQAFALRYFPGEDPLGKRIRFTYSPANPFMEIVGIVGNENAGQLDSPMPAIVYAPFLQGPNSFFNYVVRTSADPQNLISPIGATLHGMDPELPLITPQSMDQIIAESPSVFLRRYPSYLIGSFAALAVVLAMVGLYGLISFSVAQRTQEIGIRMALGAQAPDVLGLVLRHGIGLALIGVAAGAVGALALARMITSLLYGVGAADPVTFVSVAVLLTAVALVASYIPARRATKVDPMVALRYE
jgi:putative ABC transport system permease protein